MVSMRKGSLAYWPHRRAQKQMPRMRTWPESAEPGFMGLIAYKAGMTHVAMVDDTDSPAKGSEISTPVTVLEIPEVEIYGMLFYKESNKYRKAAGVVYENELAKKVGIKKPAKSNPALLEENSAFSDVTALAFVNPGVLGFGNKKLLRFEIALGGKTVGDKVAFAEKWMGKTVKIGDVISTGDFIDVKSISKGKGWAGVIKRFGVSRNARKATGKIRHVGVLGAWHPAHVMYTVPHSGHMGYNYRLEINKRVLKMGTGKDASTINVSGGFPNYGVIKNDFVMIKGSIPGPAKRLVRIRKALRNKSPKKEPVINYISIASKQGA